MPGLGLACGLGVGGIGWWEGWVWLLGGDDMGWDGMDGDRMEGWKGGW